MAEATFGEWLKRRRNSVGLTQAQLAVQLNCSLSALRKMEAELRRPSPEIVDRLAAIFEVPEAERTTFLRFARGDWTAMPGESPESEPWRPGTVSRAPRSNLPAPTTSFIGREKERTEITELIATHRLVTLTGAGGIGKTRLAIQAASRVLSDFPGGTWMVELAALSEPSLLHPTVTASLGLVEQAGRSPLMALTDFLRTKHSLLLLDNCEHLVEACAHLAETLLQACPDLHIVVTSREALGVGGEILYLVPPLALPDAPSDALELVNDYEAIRLFVDRAQASVSGFSLTEENKLAIAEICHRLDGIPLALELAAARVKVLTPDEIAARLDDRFHLLTGGARTALPRQQTLQAAIDWSHDLLSEPERVLFRRLAVFAGGWSLEAAEAICALNELNPDDILDLLTQLLNKSLILGEQGQGERMHYRMLETIRQYARTKLAEAGEEAILQERHMTYFVDLAERAEPELRSSDTAIWLDRLETELDNIRAALDWARENNVEAGLRMAGALLWFWHIRGRKEEGIEALIRLLGRECSERGPRSIWPERAAIRGKALNAVASLKVFSFEDAAKWGEESLALFQDLGPAGKRGMAYALLRLGARPGARPIASLLEESLALFREVGDKFGIAESLLYLTGSAKRGDDHEEALVLATEHLAIRRELGDLDGIATALAGLGDIALWEGDYDRAIAFHQESLAIFRQLGNRWAIGFGLSKYSDVFLWKGDYAASIKVYEESCAFGEEIGEKFLIALSHHGLGFAAWFQGDYDRATRMILKGLAAFRDLGHEELTASSLHALGDITLAQGLEDNAHRWYESELEIARKANLEMSLTFASSSAGRAKWAGGDYDLAIASFKTGLKSSQQVGHKHATFHALYGLGRVAQSRGNLVRATEYYRKALSIGRWRVSALFFDWPRLKTLDSTVAYPISAMAVMAATGNDMVRCTRLLSAAEAACTPLRFIFSAVERGEHDQAKAAARSGLGDEAFNKAWEEGKTMTLEQAIEYALQES